MPLSNNGGNWGFFGWHLVRPEHKEIILTEGEYDAIAVASQISHIPTISLPNGAQSFPVQLIPLLERFERIYLWLDDDAAGQQGLRKIAEKLGIERCFIVHSHDHKNA